jgi:hypothetical protein
MRTVTRIRVDICSMMLACTGTLSVPLCGARGRRCRADEKVFAHCAPLPFDQAG